MGPHLITKIKMKYLLCSDLWKFTIFVVYWKQEGDGELRHLSADPVQTDSSNVVYLIRPQFTVMKTIASHIQNDISKGIQKKYFIYFVPRRTVACEKVLAIINILFSAYILFSFVLFCAWLVFNSGHYFMLFVGIVIICGPTQC